jgi:3-oxoacyl-[acyl-carrier-protein] synthase-3
MLTPADVDMFLFHQGSRFIVENLAKKMQLPLEKVPFEASHIGNTVSSSLPLLLMPRLQNRPKRILMCGFGVGLSWATMMLDAV